MHDITVRADTKTVVSKKSNFLLQDLLQKMWIREIPVETTDLKTSQWRKYKKPLAKLFETLNATASEIDVQNTALNSNAQIHTLNLSNFGHNLGINDIANQILVPTTARIAMMACVDERTQSGEFIDEMNINGDLLGTISDPSIPRYVLDIPGSGALNCECNKLENTILTRDELTNLEDERLVLLAQKIVEWCKTRNIFKFTVTYHEGCGAVSLRMKKYNSLCSGNIMQVAKQCALKTARAISEVAKEQRYHLETTVGFIGDRQMCKIGPMEMHNAVGTLGCLDSRVLAHKFDKVTGLNFFDTFIYSDFKVDQTTAEEVEEIINDAVRNISITLSIATGEHGWGNDRFTKENPYLVILFANGKQQETEAIRVFQTTIQKYPDEKIDQLAFFLIRTDK